jgi:hypothetical protein
MIMAKTDTAHLASRFRVADRHFRIKDVDPADTLGLELKERADALLQQGIKRLRSGFFADKPYFCIGHARPHFHWSHRVKRGHAWIKKNCHLKRLIFLIHITIVALRRSSSACRCDAYSSGYVRQSVMDSPQ